jgi:hypothetical protein
MDPKKLISAAALALSISASAQLSTFKKPVKFNPDNIKAISDQHGVTGYFFFYTIERASIRENTYGLSLFDSKMTEIRSKEFDDFRDLELIGNDYNGEILCLQFFSRQEKTFTFVMYNESLAETGRFTIEISSDETDQMTPSPDGRYLAVPCKLHAISQTGFLVFNEIKNYAVAFSGSGQQLWEFQYTKKSTRKFHSFQFCAISGKAVLFSELYYDKIMKPYLGDKFALLIDPSSGNEIARVAIPNLDEKYPTVYNVVDEPDGFLLVAYILGKDQKSKSADLAFFKVNSTGEITDQKFVSLWNAFQQAEMKKGKTPASLKSVYVSEFVKLSNGQLYSIAYAGENVAMAMMGYTRNIDLAVFEFDPNLNIKDVTLLNDDAAAGTMKDYYHLTNTDGRSFSIVFSYKVAGHEDQGELVEERTFSTASAPSRRGMKVPVKNDEMRILMAKPGNVAIFEYFKDSREIKMRIEPLSR